MSTECSYVRVDLHGDGHPCDRPATSWRWYEGCDHDDCLAPTCDWHDNESGRRLQRAEVEVAELRATVARVRALADTYRQFSDFNITARDAEKQLRAALDGGEQHE